MRVEQEPTTDANRRLLALDPGEKFCGRAYFVGLRCVRADTCGPEQMLDELEESVSVPTVDIVVFEEFRLYPWKSQEQGFSQLKTVEVIGVIRWLCRKYAIPSAQYPALNKKPTFAILKRKRIGLIGGTQHARDAEAHGWYHLLNT